MLAVFWMILGGALVLLPRISPDAPELTIRGTGISLGWLAIALAFYNLLRWSLLVQASRRRALESTHRPPVRRSPAAQRPAEPDPNFDFQNPSPRSGDEERGGG